MKRPLLTTGLLLTLAMPSLAIQTDNYGIHAVPAPGKVSIDGQLTDWDLSGQVLMTYDIEALRDIYSGQVAAMYDADNLYLSIHWKDPIPMRNSHDPRYQANKGWAGDAVQLRIKTDRISHVTAWYYAAKQEPAMAIDYGKSLTEPFGGGSIQPFRTQGWQMEQGVEMAFKKDADGKGYVQEIKLPWKLITLGDKKFGAGDQISIGFELLWGEADWPVHRYADNLQPGAASREFFWTAKDSWGSVFLEPKGNLKLPEPAYMVAYRKAMQGDTPQGPVSITYNLPKEARVTLAIDDANGNRVRNLVPALQRPKGKNTEKWDGLDDNGKPVPPGNYSFRALYHDGIHANYVMSFANPGNPTWDSPDGRGAFYGDHTAPQAAAAAGNYIALATPMGEAGKHLIGTDLTGQRLWGLPNRVAFDGGQISLASDGKTLWVANEGKTSVIYRVEAATGRYAPWQAKTKDSAGNEFDLLELSVSDLPGTIADKANPIPANLRAIALHEGTLAVALYRENLVKLLDANTGAVKAQISVPNPQALAYSGSNLIAVSQGQLVKLSPSAAPSPLGTATYPDAYGLATDTAGNLYLSVRGADQNVKVLSPQGQLLREIGKRGGRPLVGPYDATAMRNPAGLAVDAKGHLWVTEETMNPKRTSVWDTTTGQLWKDLPGTTTYAGAGALDPSDPTLAFSDNTVYRLNLQNGTSQPIYSLGSLSEASHGTTQDNPNNIFPPVVHSLTSKIVKRGNLQYIFSGHSNDTHVTLFDGKTYRSVAHIGVVPDARNRQADINLKYRHAFFDGQEGKSYVWVDTNGDGLVQREELTFTSPLVNGVPVTLRSTYWGQLPDDAGAVPYMAMTADGQVLKDTLLRLTPNGYNAVGAPQYDITKPQIVKLSQPLVNPGIGMIAGGQDGRIYLNQNPLVTLDKTGKVTGTYPSRHVSVQGSHTARSSRPGYLIGPSSFLGMADMGGDIGEVFYLNGNLGENYLFTHDGLYIQTLFKDTRGYFDTPTQAVRGMSMDATTAGGESFGGNFIKAPNGKTYLTLGTTDARVMEVTGLNTIKRLSGKFTYTPAQYTQAQQLAAQQAAQTQAPKLFTIARTTTAPKIDGQATDWPELLDDTKPLLEIQESAQQRYGRVSARYDDQNLYLGYRVFSSRSALKNTGQDDRLLFKTGDAVDLMIGPETSPNGQGNTRPNGQGNTRILLTQVDNQPVAVLNQKTAPGAPKDQKFDFSSPWRTISFDRVITLNNVPLATSPIQGGTFVEAAIPWPALGLNPRSGLKLRGDVGILFGDTAGNQTISRQYWSNKATGLVNDVPGEADLQPELWGTFTLE